MTTDQPAEATAPEWGFLPALLCFVVAFVVAVLASAAFQGKSSTGSATRPVAVIAGAIALDATFIIGAAVIFQSRSRRHPRDILQIGDGRSIAADVILGVVVGLALQLAIGLIFNAFHIESHQEVANDIQTYTGSERALLAASAALLAPVAEELYFRVVLLRGLERRLPVIVAVVLQGAAFGLVHLSGRDTVPVVPALAAVGIVFGFLFVRGRSILCAMAAHMTFNGLAVWSLLHSTAAPR